MVPTPEVLDDSSPVPHPCPLPQSEWDKANQSAEASRFHRAFVAMSCITAVLINEPRVLYPVLLFTAVALVTSSRYEPTILFYRHLLVQGLGGDPWKIQEDDTGKYLLGNAVEKFVFTVMSLFLLAGLYLQARGAEFWIVPVAVVAAGMTLAATTGICLMGLCFVQMRKLFARPGRSGSEQGV